MKKEKKPGLSSHKPKLKVIGIMKRIRRGLAGKRQASWLYPKYGTCRKGSVVGKTTGALRQYKDQWG